MIIKNAIRCNICGDEIESKYRTATTMWNVPAEPAPSMVVTTTCEGVLKMRAVSTTYP